MATSRRDDGSRTGQSARRRAGRVGWLVLAMIAGTLLLAGCKPITREGWVPTPDGPQWVAYRVERGRAIWGGDVVFDLLELRAWQATVTLPPPLPVASYDIDNGSTALDDGYSGATSGDPSVASQYSGPVVERLEGGQGKLTDRAWPGTGPAFNGDEGLGVSWYFFQPDPIVFHLRGEQALGSVRVRGKAIEAIEVTVGGTTVRHDVAYSNQSAVYELAELGLRGNTVAVRLVGQFVTAYEVELLGERPVVEGGSSEPVPDASISAKAGWPDGRVPYELADFVPCEDKDCPKAIVEEAMRQWEEDTRYDFEEDPTALPRVRINHCPSAAWSDECAETVALSACYVLGVGRPSDRNPAAERIRQVYLHPEGCSLGTMLHELGHAVGLYHEQVRHDRDSHVRINYENIGDDRWDIFAIEAGGTDFGEYDFRSIMHYGETAYGRWACCNSEDVDTSQDGLPEGCGWFEDVSVTVQLPDRQVQMCPDPARGDVADLPVAVQLQTIAAEPGFPEGFDDVRVGQRSELSKVDVTAAHALAFGDATARSYHARFDDGLEDFAPFARYHHAGDLNGDGRDDLVAFGQDVHVALAGPDGRLEPAGVWIQDLWCDAERYCVLGDPDGNGLDDVVAFHENGSVEVWWSDGERFYQIPGAEVGHWSFGQRAAYGTAFHLADVDGDCHDDLVALDRPEYLTNDVRVRVALSEGGKLSGFGPEEVWLDFDSIGVNHGRGMSLGDVDADGMADLQQGRAVFLSTGTHFAAAQAWAPSGYPPEGWCSYSSCQLADMDGDRRADLVETTPDARRYRERFRYALSNGWRFVTEAPNYHELDCRNRVASCLLADVDGDGLADSIDAVGWRTYSDSRPGRGFGRVWVAHARELWSEDIGARKPSPLSQYSWIQSCGSTDVGGIDGF